MKFPGFIVVSLDDTSRHYDDTGKLLASGNAAAVAMLEPDMIQVIRLRPEPAMWDECAKLNAADDARKRGKPIQVAP